MHDFEDRRAWFDAHLANFSAHNTCPCCGYPTLEDRGADEICRLCGWQDDGQDDPDTDAVWGGPNYELSLTKARRNFALYGDKFGPDAAPRYRVIGADVITARRMVALAYDKLRGAETGTARRDVWLEIRAAHQQLREVKAQERHQRRMSKYVNRADIHIRDPFVLPLPDTRRYVLYGTTYLGKPHQSLGFDAYLSVEDDLERWEGPFPVLRLPEGFWGTRDFWATEVHAYDGRYYMLASLAGDNRKRGTQAFVSEDPLGPFAPVGPHALTPPDWDCLDGTLFVENETPYLVFCHEWTQINDGTIDFVPLAPDLSRAIGPPVTLFHGSDAPWATSVTGQEWTTDLNPSPEPQFVTDGPTLFRTSDNKLRMLWSTHGPTGYVLGVATSQTGTLAGPWTQAPEPVFAGDGGHGMLFRDFDKNLRLALHQPNSGDQERAHFFHVAETDDETTGGLALSSSR